MRIPRTPLVAALVATALSLPLAHAQTAPSTPAPATAPGQSKVSDQQIDKAANAMQKVMNLRQSYGQRIAQAKPEDRDRIAAEGQTAMKQAVTQQGLSVEQHNSILQTAQNDPIVRAKLLSRVTPPPAATTPGTPSAGQ